MRSRIAVPPELLAPLIVHPWNRKTWTWWIAVNIIIWASIDTLNIGGYLLLFPPITFLVGVIVGACQVGVLRRTIRYLDLWVQATALGLTIGTIASDPIPSVLDNTLFSGMTSSDPAWNVFWYRLISNTVQGAALWSIIGLTQWLVLRRVTIGHGPGTGWHSSWWIFASVISMVGALALIDVAVWAAFGQAPTTDTVVLAVPIGGAASGLLYGLVTGFTLHRIVSRERNATS